MKGAEARSLLLQLGIRPRKRQGQHFLIDPAVLKRCANYAEIEPNEDILEIGPGLGFLTEELLTRGASVTAIESDEKLCGYLKKRFGSSLSLMSGDATKIDLPEFDKVVSNLPYQISSEITFRLLEAGFRLAVLMYQREFAERLVAGEGSAIYGRLSVMAACKAESEIIEVVSKRSFWPEPKVDSAIVLLRSRPPEFHMEDERIFSKVVRILFSHRRKKIANALISEADQLGISRDEMRRIAGDIPFSNERVELLTPEEIGSISDFFSEIEKQS